MYLSSGREVEILVTRTKSLPVGRCGRGRSPSPWGVRRYVRTSERCGWKYCDLDLIRIVQLTLVSNSKDSDLILQRQKAIQGNVPSLSVGDYQLSQFALDATTDQWMISEYFDALANGRSSQSGGIRIDVGPIFERAFEIIERIGRIDYLRQGVGRLAPGFCASRSSNLWTSFAL